MLLDLLHNKIIKETATEGFLDSVRTNLVPKITAIFGEPDAICMYEDHLADDFVRDGVFYYPLTVVRGGTPGIVWISWDITDTRRFRDGVPFAFLGAGTLDFQLVTDIPDGFSAKIRGRNLYTAEKTLRLELSTVAPSKTFLAGKYSQTFVDLMSAELTRRIADTCSVAGLAESGLILRLIFAPETYMEHTCENVTYRRLLLTDKGCSPRDFWIKWTRLDGAGAYSVSDTVHPGDIRFDIAEDVPHKIREREYRFLVHADTDKYQSAMGRRALTEWRELIKREVRLGVLTKTVAVTENKEADEEVRNRLSELLAMYGKPATAAPAQPQSDAPSEDFDRAMAMMREQVNAAETGTLTASEQNPATAETFPEEVPAAESAPATVPQKPLTTVQDAPAQEPASPATENAPQNAATPEDVRGEAPAETAEPATPDIDDVPFDLKEETPFVTEIPSEPAAETVTEEPATEEPVTEEPAAETTAADKPCPPAPEGASAEPSSSVTENAVQEPASDPDAEARAREEQEKQAMREREIARIEAESAKQTEEEIARLREEKLRVETEAKIRLEYENEARRRAEEETNRLRRIEEDLKEQNRKLAEAAKAAEEARIAEELRRREEAKRMQAELEAHARREQIEKERLAEAARLAVEEEKRKAEERLREEERLRREAEERHRAEEQARIEAERAREAERLRREAEAQSTAAEITTAEPPKPEPAPAKNYTYISRTARLMFRYAIDPNVTARIQEIMTATIQYFHKEDVYIKVKATIPDSTTLLLEFVRIPAEENELLVNIIKVLGNSGLGISKIVIE